MGSVTLLMSTYLGEDAWWACIVYCTFAGSGSWGVHYEQTVSGGGRCVEILASRTVVETTSIASPFYSSIFIFVSVSGNLTL